MCECGGGALFIMYLAACVSLSLSLNAEREHSYLALVAIFLSLLDCLHRYAECGVLQFAN